MSSWGVNVSPEMSIIEGRILQPPPLTFGSHSNEWGQIINPSDGTWRISRNLRFAVPTILTTWSVAVFGDPAYFPLHTISAFVKNVLTSCVNLGMEVTEKTIADVVVYCPGRVGPDVVEPTLRLADERAREASASAFARHQQQQQYRGFDGHAGFSTSGGTYGGNSTYHHDGVPFISETTQLIICILAQKNSVNLLSLKNCAQFFERSLIW
jgi:hypothetical protein